MREARRLNSEVLRADARHTRSDVLTSIAVLGALAESEREEVMRIDEALSRIEAGTWGICESCGERIEEARLEAIPEAARCIECESGIRLSP